MRSVAVLLALVAGVAATVASSPGVAGDINGSGGPITVSLDADNTTVTKTATATLTLHAPISSAQVELHAVFPASPAAHVNLAIDSDEESNSTEVIDTSTQDDVSIGVRTWDGCTDSCSEDLTLTFDLIDTTEPVDFSVTLDGSAALAGDGSNTPADPGSIDIAVQ